jgi:hypothetical protein
MILIGIDSFSCRKLIPINSNLNVNAWLNRKNVLVLGILYLIKNFGIRYIMPNTENSYFPMSSIIYLITKKNIPNTEFCVGCVLAAIKWLVVQVP